MKPKVVLAGGTGFLGSDLAIRFQALGYEVILISRQAGHIPWNDSSRIVEALEQSELLINLAGKSVNCRYNERNKEAIMQSRTETTHKLAEALQACQNPPPLWLNSSTATIYRHAEDRPMTEDGGELGSGFSVEVAKAWEHAFFSRSLPRTRQAALRIAIVLGPGGGVMTPYLNLVKYGLGGAQGSGKQRFSWIHIKDIFRIILFLKDHPHLDGVFNCSSPNPVTNEELMRELRLHMGKKTGLPAARWMLEVGAFLMRTETELILKSRWVVPDRLEREGFTFEYPTLESALTNILKEAASPGVRV